MCGLSSGWIFLPNKKSGWVWAVFFFIWNPTQTDGRFMLEKKIPGLFSDPTQAQSDLIDDHIYFRSLYKLLELLI